MGDERRLEGCNVGSKRDLITSPENSSHDRTAHLRSRSIPSLTSDLVFVTSTVRNQGPSFERDRLDWTSGAQKKGSEGSEKEYYGASILDR